MTRLVQDSELREGFKSGETWALSAVYREYASPLYGLLHRGFVLHSAGTSVRFRGYQDSLSLDDAVQEVFSRVFTERARLSYDGLRPFRNYLFTTARNYVTDEYRRRSRLFEPINEKTLENAFAEHDAMAFRQDPEQNTHRPDPAREAEHRELLNIVECFVTGLSSEDKPIFDMRFREGLSVEACAKKLGLSEYRIKRTEKRLRKRFLDTMQRNGYLEGYSPNSKVLGAWVVLVAASSICHSMLSGAGGMR